MTEMLGPAVFLATAATGFAALMLLWRARPLPGGATALARCKISVIVPARDEEANLPRLLESLKRQTLPDVEMIVADDGSTDGTAELAGNLGALVVTVDERPQGWTGKTWACWCGVRKATGQILVFVDADTWFEPSGLERLVHKTLKSRGLVSVEPFHEVVKPYEQLSAVFNIVRTSSVGTFGLFGGNQVPAGAFGPCIALDRAAYFDVQGHSHPTVRGQILENFQLGKVMQRQGYPVLCFGGHRSVAVRMYPEGLRQLVQGWSKALVDGAQGTPPRVLTTVIGWLSGASLVAGVLPVGLVLGDTMAAVTLTAYTLVGLHMWRMARQLGTYSAALVPLYPIALIAFFAVYGSAMARKALGGPVTWRGREVQTPTSDKASDRHHGEC